MGGEGRKAGVLRLRVTSAVSAAPDEAKEEETMSAMRQEIEEVSRMMGANGTREQAERLLSRHTLAVLKLMTDDEFFRVWEASETLSATATYEVRAPGCTAWEHGLGNLEEAIESLRQAQAVAGGPPYEIVRRASDGVVESVSLDEIACAYASMRK
jgi:hypothetical protein